MNKMFIFVLCFALLVLASGCQGAKSRAGEGAVIGGVLGAAAGGIIGHQSHHGGEGAAIGAAAGALTGAIVGSQIEKPGQATPQETTQGANTAPAANPNQMSIQQIADLARQGASEDAIVEKIRLTNSKFRLSGEDINYLKQYGVSQKVIDVMQGM